MTYDQVFSTTGPTVVYTVERGTNKTIGSSLSYPNITTQLINYDLLESYVGWGGINFLDTQTLNEITTSWNPALQTIDVTAVHCLVYKWAIDEKGQPTCKLYETVPTELSSIPPLTLTSTLSFNHEHPNPVVDDALYYGDAYLYSTFSKVLGVPSSCVYIGGGVGALKVGVSVLTATSTVLVQIASSGALKVGVSVLAATSTVLAAAQVATPPPQGTVTSGIVAPQPGGVVTSIYPPSTAPQAPQSTTTSQGGSLPSNDPPVGQPGSNSENVPSASPQSVGKPPGQPASQTQNVSPDPSPSATQQQLPVAGASPVTTTIKIGTSTPTVVVLPSGSGYIIAGATIKAGSPAITVGGAIISADSSGIKTVGVANPEAAIIASIVGAQPLPNVPGPAITPAPQAIPGGSLAIGGQILTPGGRILINGVSYSLNPQGTALVVGGASENTIPVSQIVASSNRNAIVIAGQTLIPGYSIIANGQTISLDSSKALIIAGQTLKPGSVLTINSQTLSLNPAGNSIIMGESTLPISSFVTNTNNALLIGSQTLRPGSNILVGSQTLSLPALSTGQYISLGSLGKLSIQNLQSGIVISGQTLTLGGNIVVGGQTLSLASGSSGGIPGVVVGGSTTVSLLSTVVLDSGSGKGAAAAEFVGNAGRNVDVRGLWLWIIGVWTGVWFGV
ncbi:hypothetical protein HYFRA_00003550 [Hymenoscyphus fraxineus]|uniref:Uncharacterized protein n=1 Tax=Hymenoscyphus fraxineus TaxID=746836 RepID=A0A9N9KSZ6_9HELO|nr:hypothetical protein HYFRA_00003550 [Hymenoscyphus fraxineus]